MSIGPTETREEDKREEKKSFSQNKKREVYLSQIRTRQKSRGGGGWVGASSSRRNMQVACAFRSSHKRERESEREKTEGSTEEEENTNPKILRTDPVGKNHSFEISKSTKQTAMGITISKMRIVRATPWAKKILFEQPNKRREHPEKNPEEKRAVFRAIYRSYSGQTHTA